MEFEMKIRTSRPLLALLCLALLTSGCTSTMSEGSLENALLAFEEGRNADAELIWRKILSESEEQGENDPRIAQSLFVLGNLAIRQGQYDQAKPLLERWMALCERDPEVAPDECLTHWREGFRHGGGCVAVDQRVRVLSCISSQDRGLAFSGYLG